MVSKDSELVQAFREGDRDAFATLLERHRPRVVSLAARIVADRGSAEDVAQEAAYQAFFCIDTLRDASRFGSWLCGIAVNLAKMAVRRRPLALSIEALSGGWRASAFDLADPVTPEAEYEALEMRETIRRALDDLPAGMKDAVWLHYVEGLSYQDVSALTGIPPGTLRVLSHRARQRLRLSLAGEWSRGTSRKEEEDLMIEVTVEDLRVRLPEAWKPDPNANYRMPAASWAVLLKERGSQRGLAMWVRSAEGEALAMQLAGFSAPRPLTYDFIARLLDALEARVERVAITSLSNDVYFAKVSISSAGRSFEIDSRPSDALNLALRKGAPVFVAEDVLERVGFDFAQRTTGAAATEGFIYRSGVEAVAEAWQAMMEAAESRRQQQGAEKPP